MKTRIDHLVIGAKDLAEGVEYARACFGVELPFGGVHPKMGTHNHLMQLGDEMFLEIIAVNPDSPPLNRPRWFSLDDPLVGKQLAESPCFLTWVVNTENIRALLKRAKVSFGRPERLQRGHLSWDFGLPADGRLLAGGCLPYIIQWHTRSHPATAMRDLECRLECLEIHHPYAAWITDILDSIHASGLVKIHQLSPNEAPRLKARIRSPKGTVILKTAI